MRAQLVNGRQLPGASEVPLLAPTVELANQVAPRAAKVAKPSALDVNVVQAHQGGDERG